MKRPSHAAGSFLTVGLALMALAIFGAALLPVVECPRRGVPKEDSEFVRVATRINHDVLGCAICGGRGKVTLLRRWVWRNEPPP